MLLNAREKSDAKNVFGNLRFDCNCLNRPVNAIVSAAERWKYVNCYWGSGLFSSRWLEATFWLSLQQIAPQTTHTHHRCDTRWTRTNCHMHAQNTVLGCTTLCKSSLHALTSICRPASRPANGDPTLGRRYTMNSLDLHE
jgi:hypothetical protein